MIDEVVIEFSQRHRRTLSIVAGNLATPQQIVNDDHTAAAQTLQTKIEILFVLFLHRIDE